MLLVMLFARAHVNDFWKAKAKVPFVDGYNEAITRSNDLLQIMKYLEWSWALTSVCAGFLGY